MLCHRVMTTLEADVPPFQVEPITVGECAVLRVAGEVDVYTAPELRQQLSKLVDSGAWRVVDFLDSSGLGVLEGGLKRLRTHQGSLEIVTSGGQIQELFELTGLSRAFTVHPSVLAAITADQYWQAALAGEGDSAEDWCRTHELLA